MNKDYADFLLNKTKDDYNRIADKFSSTRGYVSGDILVLAQYAEPDDKILDLGCGNGRLSEIFKNKRIRYTGVDFSKELIKIARKKYPKEKFLLADAMKLPALKNIFDKVYCLSVLHHIPSEEYRIKFLKEIKRVLLPCGKIVLTVWNMHKVSKARALIFKNNFLRFFGLSKLDFNDLFYPFNHQSGKREADRYIHAFRPNELARLVQKSGFKVEEIKFLKRGKKQENENILIVAKK